MSSTVRFGIITLLLTVSVVLAIVVYDYTRPMQVASVTEPVVPQPLTGSYLVAAHPLPAGKLANEADFTGKPVPATELPAGVMTDTPETRAGLLGSMIRNFIDTGLPITQADLLRPKDRGFIASVLRDGYRAVAIGVDPVTGVAGLIWPGDHVDLLLTQDMGDKEPASNRAIGETILNDVRVIAIDQEIVQGASTAGKLVRTVTLEVNPAQAQKVAVASTMGKLSLTIRAASDARTSQLRMTRSADVSPALEQPASQTVKVYQGKEATEVRF